MGNTERSSGASTRSPWRSALARFSELPSLHPRLNRRRIDLFSGGCRYPLADAASGDGQDRLILGHWPRDVVKILTHAT